MSDTFRIGSAEVGGRRPLLVAGPCVVEEGGMLGETAAFLAELAARIGWPLVFKASYRKDNRLSGDSFSGLGDAKALELLAAAAGDLPVLTDVHGAADVAAAAEIASCLQIPAFLCRQTSLLEAAGGTGLVVNIKKGQFMAPEDLAHSAAKAMAAGAAGVMLTERGSSFGHRDLVVDFRSFPLMAASGHPVIFDLTHSQQKPGASGGCSGGTREFAATLGRAALAAGIDGLFLEVHPDPPGALSDSATQLSFAEAETLLKDLASLQEAMEVGDVLP